MLEYTVKVLCNFNPRQEPALLLTQPWCEFFLAKWVIMGDVLKIPHKAGAIYSSYFWLIHPLIKWSKSWFKERCSASPPSGDWIRVMAHLHCRRRTWVRARILIPFLYSCSWQLGLESESDSVQCETFCIVQCSHWFWSPNPNPNQAV